jgi:hypothetical protein
MKILSLFLTIIVLFSFVLGNSAKAESWRNVSKDNRHMAIYKNTTFVEFNPKNNTWYLGFGIEKNADVSQPMVTLTAPNGASTLFRINTDLTIVRDNLDAGIKTLAFPIDEDILEYLQSNSNIMVQLGDDKYASPLTGSRKAISTAMKRVAHDAAIADDEQHAIDQAESDAAQAIARNDRAVPLGGVQHWTYRGQKNVGTVAESYEAAASVDDDIMSLVYFPHDDALSIWFTLNGNKSLSYEHAERAEIFIRTRDVSGGDGMKVTMCLKVIPLHNLIQIQLNHKSLLHA